MKPIPFLSQYQPTDLSQEELEALVEKLVGRQGNTHDLARLLLAYPEMPITSDNHPTDVWGGNFQDHDGEDMDIEVGIRAF